MVKKATTPRKKTTPESKTTKQAVKPRKKRGGNINGKVTNPKGRGGFGDNPQNRNDGRWSAEHSISHQYNRFIRMTALEFRTWRETTPDTERTMAMEIAFEQVWNARNSRKDHDKLASTKEISDRTEGKAPVVANINVSDNEAINNLSVDELRQLANL